MNTSISNTNNLIASTHCTPTKKCPSSCGKLTEKTVFNFNDSYVTEYLKQQQLQQQNQHSSHQNQVFNRPITRSITHHNNKFNGNGYDSFTSTTLLPSSNDSNDINKTNCSNLSSDSALSCSIIIEPPLCTVPVFTGKFKCFIILKMF
jgi:hypothetical protein